MESENSWRKTTQYLAPSRQISRPEDGYVLYPGFSLGPGKILPGFDTLAAAFDHYSRIVIDGDNAVFWDDFRDRLDKALAGRGRRAAWRDVSSAMRPNAEIDSLVGPFLGGDDPLFGTRFTGELADFFDPLRLAALSPDPQADVTLLYGCGAALAGWDAPIAYVDVPKNEIQFRSRAGRLTNLGSRRPEDPKKMYKRFYFVDWVALNRHKAALLPEIDWMVDGQRPGEPTWMHGADLRAGLDAMAHSFFRVRPWFEPGPWGGHWIEAHIPDLARDVPNYAWSFELISPENGLLFQSEDYLLEISFDFLMFQEYRAVLGLCADRFGYEFPVRYDFLDTVDGGNLSVQVHPRLEYIRRNFGETITQDEAYYILDCQPGAEVYLGFQPGINPQEFRRALEQSFATAQPLEIDRYVNKVPSHKHDLLLIPSGTIHGSGKGNLVLEISATPYIFTFKMYDWLRPDLDGKPRPLNIDRAFENLIFERRGDRVRQELVSHPRLLAEGPGWRLTHLPTHPEHFYDVHRLEFDSTVEVDTQGSCHVLMVVGGPYCILETTGGQRQRFNYAETFIVPAAAEKYQLTSPIGTRIQVVKTFLKTERC